FTPACQSATFQERAHRAGAIPLEKAPPAHHVDGQALQLSIGHSGSVLPRIGSTSGSRSRAGGGTISPGSTPPPHRGESPHPQGNSPGTVSGVILTNPVSYGLGGRP